MACKATAQTKKGVREYSEDGALIIWHIPSAASTVFLVWCRTDSECRLAVLGAQVI